MSAKKKTFAECKKCGCVILIRDEQKHSVSCGTIGEDEVPFLQKSGIFSALVQHVDKFEDYLAPEAIGWTKKHAVLMNPMVLELWEITTRHPLRLKFGTSEAIVVAWPCKDVSMLRVASRLVPKERLITLQKVSQFVEINRIEIKLVEKSILNALLSVESFLQAYLSNAYVCEGLPLEITYFGQQLNCYPKTPIDVKLEQLALSEPPEDSVPVLRLEEHSSILVSVLENDKIELQDDMTNPFELIGGCSNAKEVLHRYVIDPAKKGSEAICSVLLFGLPGCGKTMLVNAAASKLGASALKVSTLDELIEKASLLTPKIVLLADIVEYPKEHKAYALLNEIAFYKKAACVVLTARSRDDIELGVRVRFPREVEVAVPTEIERLDILRILSKQNPPSNELVEIARRTHGYTGCDLASLIKVATLEPAKSLDLSLEKAIRLVRPTGIRQFTLEVPTVKFSDIGGNDELKLEIQQAVLWPRLHPEAFSRLGIEPPAGILLYGPPGCSKTLIARALANESKMNFLAVKGPELFSKWVGESERAIRELFARARQVAPTIVFFDEIDAVGQARGATGSPVGDRVLAQLLTELDGLEKQSGVVLLAATNRPDQLDSALLRPGRLDRSIYVGLPNAATRREIIEMSTKTMSQNGLLAADFDISQLELLTAGYSGAEIVAVCRTAAMIAMRENVFTEHVSFRHFEGAFATVVPRTDKQLLEVYAKFRAGTPL